MIVWVYTPNCPREVGSKGPAQAQVLCSLKKSSEFDILRFHRNKIPELRTLALQPGDRRLNESELFSVYRSEGLAGEVVRWGLYVVESYYHSLQTLEEVGYLLALEQLTSHYKRGAIGLPVIWKSNWKGTKNIVGVS